MDLYRVNLNLLIALDHLLTEKSVTNAAKKLAITQAAMSNNLQQLRELFTDDLLVREKHHMLLTPYAKDIHPKLHQIIEELRTLITDGQRFIPEKSERVFKIGMSDYMVSLVMPGLLKYLEKNAPHIRIIIAPIQYACSSDPFEVGDYDLAISKLFSSPPSIRSTLLFKDKGVCLLNPRHPLAKKKKITLAEYIAGEHVAVRSDKNSYFSSLIDQTLLQLGVERRVQLALPFVTPIFKILESSETLIGTMIKSMATLYQHNTHCIIKPLPFEMPYGEFYLVWHQRHANDPGHQWLREVIERLIAF